MTNNNQEPPPLFFLSGRRIPTPRKPFISLPEEKFEPPAAVGSFKKCWWCEQDFAWPGKRRYCFDCLPAHGDDPEEYQKRYEIMNAGLRLYGHQPRSSANPHTQPTPVAPVEHPCGVCGTPTLNPRVCSLQCAGTMASYTKILIDEGFVIKPIGLSRLCAQCGKMTMRPRYCSDRCSRQAERRRNRQRDLDRQKVYDQERGHSGRCHLKPCLRCSWPTPRPKYCSEFCAMAASKPRRRKISNKVREIVYNRDGWICYLCGLPVDPSVSTQSKLGATIDHVIPVNAGGSDEIGNLRLAHRGCNSSKRDNSDRKDGYDLLGML